MMSDDNAPDSAPTQTMEEQLREILGGDPLPGDGTQGGEVVPDDKPKKPRYACAGSRRTDEETGQKHCDYKAYRRWYTACPKCRRLYACLPIKKGEENVASRTTAGASDYKPPVYIPTGVPEFDKVIGGGIREGKVLLVGGTRGSGKSTLLFQVGDGFAKDGRKTYFASGEMSREDNEDYVGRLKIKNPNLIIFSNMNGIDVHDLAEDVLATGAKLLIIDSLKNCENSNSKGSLGSAMMMDDVVEYLLSFAKIKKISIIIISHLSKSGDYSGSEKVQHLVDGLVRFDSLATMDGDQVVMDGCEGLREIYMSAKNRQGSSRVKALVELVEDGDAPGIRAPSMRAIRARAKGGSPIIV